MSWCCVCVCFFVTLVDCSCQICCLSFSHTISFALFRCAFYVTLLDSQILNVKISVQYGFIWLHTTYCMRKQKVAPEKEQQKRKKQQQQTMRKKVGSLCAVQYNSTCVLHTWCVSGFLFLFIYKPFVIQYNLFPLF